jgi:hypothetical protein
MRPELPQSVSFASTSLPGGLRMERSAAQQVECVPVLPCA